MLINYSASVNSSNKLILHLDFNSYFASVEQQANPFLRGKPIAVAGKGKNSIDLNSSKEKRVSIKRRTYDRTVITTASIEAKKMGVKTAMSSLEAMKICPELIIVPGDPRKYADITARFMKILNKFCDSVEQFSTDEAFADITFSGGDKLGAIFLAEMIRHEIAKDIGYSCTVSIGIASSRIMAKLASESVKPNGLTFLDSGTEVDFIRKQKLSDICGIGPNIEKKLNELGIFNFAQLAKASRIELFSSLQNYGLFLHDLANGIYFDEVNEEIRPPKSIGNSYTFGKDIKNLSELKMQILAMSDKVAFRLRNERMTARKISFFIRYAERHGSISKNWTMHEPVDDGLDIYRITLPFLSRYLEIQLGIRMIGISVSNLQPLQVNEYIFQKDRQKNKLIPTIDNISNKYGYGTLKRLMVKNVYFKERTSGFHYD
jgi:DNA polymerase-4